jgi:ribonuclease P protein component
LTQGAAYGFSKLLRLKTRPQFQAVLAGKTLARTPHFVLHVAVPSAAEPVKSGEAEVSLFPGSDVWVGAMVPKRWAKRAVTRNSIKRQIYTVSAEFESSLKPVAHLVRLRSVFDRNRYVSATSDALKVAVRAELVQLFSMARSSGVAP